MTYVFDQFGRLIGVAFPAAPLEHGEPVHVFNDHGQLIGIAYC